MDNITSKNETIFKPHYSGRAAFSLYFWPISAIAFTFFAYDMIRTSDFYAEGLLTLMFALATFSPAFIYFRAIYFGEEITVKRYFLRDVIIQYEDIISFQYFSLRTPNARISLNNLTPKSFEELDGIIDRLIGEEKIKLKKRH
jgi:hypothetical protein